MTTIILSALVFAVLIYCYLADVRNARERRELYQRIQAPQQAINEVIAEQLTVPTEAYVAVDDDAGFQAYKAGLES